MLSGPIPRGALSQKTQRPVEDRALVPSLGRPLAQHSFPRGPDCESSHSLVRVFPSVLPSEWAPHCPPFSGPTRTIHTSLWGCDNGFQTSPLKSALHSIPGASNTRQMLLPRTARGCTLTFSFQIPAGPQPSRVATCCSLSFWFLETSTSPSTRGSSVLLYWSRSQLTLSHTQAPVCQFALIPEDPGPPGAAPWQVWVPTALNHPMPAPACSDPSTYRCFCQCLSPLKTARSMGPGCCRFCDPPPQPSWGISVNI